MSTDLVACQKCGEQLSPYVVTCPRCGHCRRNSRKRFRLRLFGESSNVAGHVLESVYPRQGQQLPPPEPKPPQTPAANAPEQKPPTPPPDAPVSVSPAVKETVETPQPTAETSQVAQPPVTKKPLQEKSPVISQPPASANKAESVSKPVRIEVASDHTAPPETSRVETQPEPSSTSVEQPVEPASRSSASVEEDENFAASAPAELMQPAARLESLAEEKLSTIPSDVPPESFRQAYLGKPQAQPEVTPAPEAGSLPSVSEASADAVLPQEPSSEELAEQIKSHVVKASVAPVEQVENQVQETDLPIDETANEMIAGQDDEVEQEPSESDSEEEAADEDYSEEDSDEEYEAPAKTNNARVVLVVVLMIVGAIAIKIAISFF